MKKSILMGTREDVIKHRAKQADNTSVSHCPSIGAYPSTIVSVKVTKASHCIETFNHPCINS